MNFDDVMKMPASKAKEAFASPMKNALVEKYVRDLEEMLGIVGWGVNSDPQSKKYGELSKLFRTALLSTFEHGVEEGRKQYEEMVMQNLPAGLTFLFTLWALGELKTFK